MAFSSKCQMTVFEFQAWDMRPPAPNSPPQDDVFSYKVYNVIVNEKFTTKSAGCVTLVEKNEMKDEIKYE